MLTYIRRSPSAFWIALVGVGFFLCVFFSGIWGEMSPFALIFLVPAYLLVAVLTAIHNPIAWAIAFGFATLIALFEVVAAVGFVVGSEHLPEVAMIHATGAVIAAAAAASALLAAIRTPRPTSHIGAAG